MDSNPTIVVIPFWVKDVLDHTGQSAKDLFDYNVVSQILSQEEQAVLLASQTTALSIFKPMEFGADGWSLMNAWKESGTPEANTVADLSNKLVASPSFAQELLSRYSEPCTNAYSPDKFNVIDMSPQRLGLVIRPNILYQGMHVARNDLYAMIQEILMQLHKTMTFEQVTGLNLYTTYFKLMQQSK